jgi:hypothetical protein
MRQVRRGYIEGGGWFTFPDWSGRCVDVKVGRGIKNDWAQKDESF